MHVHVIGAGAVGATLAVRLHQAGHEVQITNRSPLQGLRWTDVKGRATTAPARPFEGHADLTVLATRIEDVLDALRDVEGPVLSLQNGLSGARLAPLLGDRLVAGTVTFPATRAAPGQSVQTGPGGLLIGRYPGGVDAVCKEVAKAFAPAVPTRTRKDMEGTQWSKLLVNSCITSLGAVTGRPLGSWLSTPEGRAVVLRLLKEGVAVAKANDVTLRTIDGLRPDWLTAPGGQVLLAAAARRHRRHHSSSLQALERGGKTEVDHLNGAVVAHADGIEVPTHEAVLATVRAIEDGDPPGMHHLALLAS